MRIYIESTIPIYVVARPARDILQADRQKIEARISELEKVLLEAKSKLLSPPSP